MDVTSLLNTASAAQMEVEIVEGTSSRNSPEQTSPTPSAISGSTNSSPTVRTPSPLQSTPPRRANDVRLSIRSRTPWDAGGYSLPLTLDTKRVQAPCLVRADLYSESPSESLAHGLSVGLSLSPHSPRHKNSDSHSSYSSYASSYASSSTSSANSISHSRFSSLSTVSEFQQHSAFTPDISTSSWLSGRMPEMGSTVTCPVPTLGHVQPPSPAPVRSAHDGGENPPEPARDNNLTVAAHTRSPSDAALMAKQATLSEANSLASRKTDEAGNSLFVPNSPSPFKHHKRAISAPNIPPIRDMPLSVPVDNSASEMEEEVAETQDLARPLGPMADWRRTEPIRSTLNIALPQGPITSEQDLPCMFTDDCNTGSQRRKAISHFFGRNKLCTRKIPMHIWVIYCRKHYQRCRYRNAELWNIVQGQLVQEQISRIHAWSEDNQAKGEGDVVASWELVLRQREKTRRGEMKEVTGQKRRHRDDEDQARSGDEEDDNGDNGEDGSKKNDGDKDSAVEHGSIVPGNRRGSTDDDSGGAVPGWLVKRCRAGYSTDEIKRIVEMIQARLDSGELKQFPDIEILPVFVSDSPATGRTRPPLRRRSAAPAAHRRSQSLQIGGSPFADVNPAFHRASQLGYRPSQDLSRLQPVEKRQRIGEVEDGYGEPSPLVSFPRGSGMERVVPMMMPRPQHAPARPTLDLFRQPYGNEGLFQGRPGGNPASYGYGGYGSSRPLPAPVGPRLGSTSSMLPPETAPSLQGYPDTRRSMHQRSYSEMGPPGQTNPASYRPASPVTHSHVGPTSLYTSYPSSASSASTNYASSPPETGYTHAAAPGYAAPYEQSFAAGRGHTGEFYHDLGHRSAGSSTSGPPQPHMLHAHDTTYSMPSTHGDGMGRPAHARHQSTPNVPRLATLPSAGPFATRRASDYRLETESLSTYRADPFAPATRPHHARHASTSSVAAPHIPSLSAPRAMDDGHYPARQ